MKKGDVVGNIIVIDVKERGRLQMSKKNIARWILLEILFLDFLCLVWIPIFEGMFTLNT
jgi:hypothetical protein